MVQLTARSAPGPVLLVLGLLAGAASIALGVGLLGRVETGFGAVWACGFVILGLIVLASAVATQPRWSRAAPPARDEVRAGEPTRFHPRRGGLPTATTFVVTGLLGAWFVAIGVTGAVERTWLWAVLALVPATYFSGFTILWAAGRFRPGGVRVTPTRVIDEHYGLRSELALADVAGMSPRSETLHLEPLEGVSPVHRRLTPRPWRARVTPGALVIRTGDLDSDGRTLVEELQRRLA
ncbi:hypothetical protein [Nocardioides sp. YIM 152315]|uniref:hypothetical protein n=1 Tax=Nocardioides sp. YIM 152315 TaxID=3031760 RepID=UPI0023DCB08D|nr:hypothetical protein [Nocardioides sp. YIM 152315]MDF1605138.1 hypothetical protein [Nocardioides sp. YIM 152315]